jgi:hypothetical protein
MNHIEEMRLAAELVQNENFMGHCEGGLPLIAFEDACRFCGAAHNEKCRRRDAAISSGDRGGK